MQRKPVVALVILVLALTAIAHRWVAQPQDVTLPRPLALFPTEIGEWSATNSLPPDFLRSDRHADATLVRSYARHTAAVWFSVTYYRRQWDERRLLASTLVDLGEGWTLLRAGRLVVTPASRRHPLRVATLLRQRGSEQTAILYWYQLADRTFPDVWSYRLALLWHTLTLRRSEGALVRVAARTEGGDLSSLVDFITAVDHELRSSLPQGDT